MKNYPNVIQRMFNTPILAHPHYVAAAQNVILSRLGADTLKPGKSMFFDDDDDDVLDVDPAVRRRPHRGLNTWYRHELYDNIGVLPITGGLTYDGPGGFASLGATYRSMADDFRAMNADDSIDGIALMGKSPGGEANHLFATVAEMIEAKNKPVRTFINEYMYSAAYGMAVVGDDIYVTSTSGGGSIGVVLTLFEYSKQLEAMGVNATLIHSGAKKVLGNSLEPITDLAIAEFQQECDEMWDVFIESVAANRPKLSAREIRNLEAGTFQGKKLIDLGLADHEVDSEKGFFDQFRVDLKNGGTTRSSSSKSTEAAFAITHNEEDEQVSEEALAKAREEGAAAAAQLNARNLTVMASPLMDGARKELGMEWLMEPTMNSLSAERILEMLEKVPAPEAAAPAGDDGSEDSAAMKRMLAAAERAEGGGDVIPNRGEGSGDNDGTGEHRDGREGKGKGAPAKYKYRSRTLPENPGEAYGGNRGAMMDGFLATAEKLKNQKKARKHSF